MKNTFSWSVSSDKISLRFIDSYKFMSSKLEDIVKNNVIKNKIPKCKTDKGHICDHFCGREYTWKDECEVIDTKKTREMFKLTSEFLKDNAIFKRLLRKGVYPYDHITSHGVLNETKMPPIENFFSKLDNKGISQEDYDYASKLFNDYGLKTLTQYHDLYLVMDVHLLADVFMTFRKECMSTYGLEPLHYYMLPGFGWDAMLKYMGIELEILDDIDMILFIKKGIRGGISQVSHKM